MIFGGLLLYAPVNSYGNVRTVFNLIEPTTIYGTVAEPEGVQRVRSNPTPCPRFKYPMKMKQFGLNETKLFQFHGIFRENEIK